MKFKISLARGLWLRASYFVLIVISLAGCSKGCRNQKDVAVENTPMYRTVNTQCRDLDLSSHKINSESFKKILDCFNTYGAIDPLVKLTQKLNEKQFEVLVDAINNNLLNSPKQMYEIEQTYVALKENGGLDSTLKELGQFLESEKLFISSISLLKQIYFTEHRKPDQYLLKSLEQIGNNLSPVQVIELIDQFFSWTQTPAYISLQKKIQSHPVDTTHFKQIVSDGLEFIKSLEKPKQKILVDQLVEVLQSGAFYRVLDETIGSTPEEIKRNVPRIASIMNIIFKKGPNKDAELFYRLSELFKKLNGPIYCFDQSKWIPNVDRYVLQEMGSKRESKEVIQWITKENPLLLSALSPFCEIPDVVGLNYFALIELAQSPAMNPLLEVLKSFEKNNLIPFLLTLLSQEDYPNNESISFSIKQENEKQWYATIEKMLPLLSEFTDRGVWEDVLFLLMSHRASDRLNLDAFLQEIQKPIPDLNGGTAAQWIFHAVKRVESNTVYEVIDSLIPFLRSEKPFLNSLLGSFRKNYYLNNVHPFIDIFGRFLSESTKNEQFLTLLLDISETPEFLESVRLISRMSQNGQLGELMGVTVSIFHKFSIQGEFPITLGVAPALKFERAHSFSYLDVHSIGRDWQIGSGENGVGEGSACSTLDPRKTWVDFNNRESQKQFDQLIRCLSEIGESGKNNDKVQALNFLRETKTTRGEPLLNFGVRLLNKLKFTQKDLAHWIDEGVSFKKNGNLKFVIDWSSKATEKFSAERFKLHFPTSDHLWSERSWFQTFLSWSSKIIYETKQRQSQWIELFRDWTKDDQSIRSVISSIKWFSSLGNKEPRFFQIRRWQPSYDFPRIKRWIQNRECTLDQWKQDQRLKEIIVDYENARTGWEMLPNGQMRRSWNRKDLVDAFKPIIDEFFSQSNGNNNQSQKITQALVNFVRYFTLKSDAKSGYPIGYTGAFHPNRNSRQHYAPEYIARFFSERSRDHEIIRYFYPGEKTPRVRLVNSLDKFELLLVNADFSYLDWLKPGNFGIGFLGMIAEAWGDEPFSVWPEFVQRKYSQFGRNCAHAISEEERKRWVAEKRCPMKLRDAYNEIVGTLQLAENTIGYPEFPNVDGCVNPIANLNDAPNVQEQETKKHAPLIWAGLHPFEVKAATFNMAQVLNVVEKNLPDSKHPHRGGLKLFRDLLYEFYVITPPENRLPGREKGNQLNIVTKLVKLGVARQLSRIFVEFAPIGYPEQHLDEEARIERANLLQFIYAFVDATTHYKSTNIANTFAMSSQAKTVIWNVFHQVFDILDAAEGNLPNQYYYDAFYRESPASRAKLLDQWRKESRAMKQSAVLGITQFTQLGLLDSGLSLSEDILKNNFGLVIKASREIKDMVRSLKMLAAIQALGDQSAQGLSTIERQFLVAQITKILSFEKRMDDLIYVQKFIEDFSKPGTLSRELYEKSFILEKELGISDKIFTGVDKIDFNLLEKKLLSLRPQINEFLTVTPNARLSDFQESLFVIEQNSFQLDQLIQALSKFLQHGEADYLIDLAHRSIVNVQNR